MPQAESTGGLAATERHADEEAEKPEPRHEPSTARIARNKAFNQPRRGYFRLSAVRRNSDSCRYFAYFAWYSWTVKSPGALKKVTKP